MSSSASTTDRGAAAAKQAKATSRSAAVKAQEQRIIAALKLRSMTTDDFRKIGIFQISARIWGLRAQGYNITTDRITVVDRDGYPHPRAGLYSLVSEPEGGAE